MSIEIVYVYVFEIESEVVCYPRCNFIYKFVNSTPKLLS